MVSNEISTYCGAEELHFETLKIEILLGRICVHLFQLFYSRVAKGNKIPFVIHQYSCWGLVVPSAQIHTPIFVYFDLVRTVAVGVSITGESFPNIY